MPLISSSSAGLALFVVLGAAAVPSGSPGEQRPGIDVRSYRLGTIAGFAEVVGAGVKRLALSDTLTEGEFAALAEEAREIAARYHVKTYVERDLLVTDLFPEDVAKGKVVILLYQDPVLDEYLGLKAERERLLKAGAYQGGARTALARRFGRLLSYSEAHLDEMLKRK